MWIYDIVQVLRLGIIQSPFIMGFFIFSLGVAVGQFYSSLCDYLNAE
jgi:hypothetical protein